MPTLTNPSNRDRRTRPIDTTFPTTPVTFAEKVRVALANPPSAGNSVADFLASIIARVAALEGGSASGISDADARTLVTRTATAIADTDRWQGAWSARSAAYEVNQLVEYPDGSGTLYQRSTQGVDGSTDTPDSNTAWAALSGNDLIYAQRIRDVYELLHAPPGIAPSLVAAIQDKLRWITLPDGAAWTAVASSEDGSNYGKFRLHGNGDRAAGYTGFDYDASNFFSSGATGGNLPTSDVGVVWVLPDALERRTVRLEFYDSDGAIHATVGADQLRAVPSSFSIANIPADFTGYWLAHDDTHPYGLGDLPDGYTVRLARAEHEAVFTGALEYLARPDDADDAGRAAVVNAEGEAYTEGPKLPTPASGDAGRPVVANADEDGYAISDSQRTVPNPRSADIGKTLIANAGGLLYAGRPVADPQEGQGGFPVVVNPGETGFEPSTTHVLVPRPQAGDAGRVSVVADNEQGYTLEDISRAGGASEDFSVLAAITYDSMSALQAAATTDVHVIPGITQVTDAHYLLLEFERFYVFTDGDPEDFPPHRGPSRTSGELLIHIQSLPDLFRDEETSQDFAFCQALDRRVSTSATRDGTFTDAGLGTNPTFRIRKPLNQDQVFITWEFDTTTPGGDFFRLHESARLSVSYIAGTSAQGRQRLRTTAAASRLPFPSWEDAQPGWSLSPNASDPRGLLWGDHRSQAGHDFRRTFTANGALGNHQPAIATARNSVQQASAVTSAALRRHLGITGIVISGAAADGDQVMLLMQGVLETHVAGGPAASGDRVYYRHTPVDAGDGNMTNWTQIVADSDDNNVYGVVLVDQNNFIKQVYFNCLRSTAPAAQEIPVPSADDFERVLTVDEAGNYSLAEISGGTVQELWGEFAVPGGTYNLDQAIKGASWTVPMVAEEEGVNRNRRDGDGSGPLYSLQLPGVPEDRNILLVAIELEHTASGTTTIVDRVVVPWRGGALEDENTFESFHLLRGRIGTTTDYRVLVHTAQHLDALATTDARRGVWLITLESGANSHVIPADTLEVKVYALRNYSGSATQAQIDRRVQVGLNGLITAAQIDRIPRAVTADEELLGIPFVWGWSPDGGIDWFNYFTGAQVTTLKALLNTNPGLANRSWTRNEEGIPAWRSDAHEHGGGWVLQQWATAALPTNFHTNNDPITNLSWTVSGDGSASGTFFRHSSDHYQLVFYANPRLEGVFHLVVRMWEGAVGTGTIRDTIVIPYGADSPGIGFSSRDDSHAQGWYHLGFRSGGSTYSIKLRAIAEDTDLDDNVWSFFPLGSASGFPANCHLELLGVVSYAGSATQDQIDGRIRASGVISSSTIQRIQTLTYTQWRAITTKDPSTLYLFTGA